MHTSHSSNYSRLNPYHNMRSVVLAIYERQVKPMVLTSGAVFLCFLVVIYLSKNWSVVVSIQFKCMDDSFFHLMNIGCIRNIVDIVETSYNSHCYNVFIKSKVIIENKMSIVGRKHLHSS